MKIGRCISEIKRNVLCVQSDLDLHCVVISTSLAFSSLKSFADDNLIMAQMALFLCERNERNIEGKGENAD